jgi:hypothetical protein
VPTRFVLTDIEERNILDDNAYDIFEPTLQLLIDGKNVLEQIGVDGIRRAVVMHFMESALKVTRRMVDDLVQGLERGYTYWFLGTGYGIRAKRDAMTLELTLEIDPNLGPVNTPESSRKTLRLGHISVKDWVGAIISLSRELNGLFYRLNPKLRAILKDQEKQRQTLETWLDSANS